MFRIRKLLGLPDPLASGAFPVLSIIRQILYSKKNLDFYSFVTSLWLSIFEELCKCISKKTREKNYFLLASGRLLRKEQDPELDPELDPDPLVRGTDPRIRIWIRTKMSQIRNTSVGDGYG